MFDCDSVCNQIRQAATYKELIKVYEAANARLDEFDTANADDADADNFSDIQDELTRCVDNINDDLNARDSNEDDDEE